MKINLDEGYIIKKDIEIENTNIILYSVVNTDKFDNKIDEYETKNNYRPVLCMNYSTANFISKILFGKPFCLSENLIPMYKGREIVINDDLEKMEVEIIDKV